MSEKKERIGMGLGFLKYHNSLRSKNQLDEKSVRISPQEVRLGNQKNYKYVGAKNIDGTLGYIISIYFSLEQRLNLLNLSVDRDHN